MSAGRVSDDVRQLPRGRHGLTRGAVVANQRQRLLRAVPAAVREKGFSSLTVEDISARAGVSRRTFYENFRDKEDCFISSYRQHAQELTSLVAGAAATSGDWHQRADLALRTLLHFLAHEPDVAHMAVIEVMAAGPVALVERDQAVVRLASLIDDRAFAVSVEHPPPRLLLTSIAGAILQLIYGWVLADRSDRLEELLPAITYMVLVTRHGPAGAAARARLSAASAANHGDRASRVDVGLG